MLDTTWLEMSIANGFWIAQQADCFALIWWNS
jgi:hypothetical protein